MSVRKDAYVWTGVGLILAAVLVVGVLFVQTYHQTVTVRLGDGIFRARVVSTDAQREKGLSGVTQLDEQAAMLFVYPKDQTNKIWMKDMKIAIDVVWLDAKKRVVHMESSLQPKSYPKTYGPSRATRYVIELPEGSIQRKAIKIGSQAVFDEPRGGAS